MAWGTSRSWKAKIRTLPYEFNLVERHPLGSQAFIPMSEHGFLVIVAPDENGTPGAPIAFETQPGQGINFHKGTWHGVLTPLAGTGQFAVVDRIGYGNNLTEFLLKQLEKIEEYQLKIIELTNDK